MKNLKEARLQHGNSTEKSNESPVAGHADEVHVPPIAAKLVKLNGHRLQAWGKFIEGEK